MYIIILLSFLLIGCREDFQQPPHTIMFHPERVDLWHIDTVGTEEFDKLFKSSSEDIRNQISGPYLWFSAKIENNTDLWDNYTLHLFTKTVDTFVTFSQDYSGKVQKNLYTQCKSNATLPATTVAVAPGETRSIYGYIYDQFFIPQHIKVLRSKDFFLDISKKAFIRGLHYGILIAIIITTVGISFVKREPSITAFFLYSIPLILYLMLNDGTFPLFNFSPSSIDKAIFIVSLLHIASLYNFSTKIFPPIKGKQLLDQSIYGFLITQILMIFFIPEIYHTSRLIIITYIFSSLLFIALSLKNIRRSPLNSTLFLLGYLALYAPVVNYLFQILYITNNQPLNLWRIMNGAIAQALLFSAILIKLFHHLKKVTLPPKEAELSRDIVLAKSEKITSSTLMIKKEAIDWENLRDGYRRRDSGYILNLHTEKGLSSEKLREVVKTVKKYGGEVYHCINGEISSYFDRGSSTLSSAFTLHRITESSDNHSTIAISYGDVDIELIEDGSCFIRVIDGLPLKKSLHLAKWGLEHKASIVTTEECLERLNSDTSNLYRVVGKSLELNCKIMELFSGENVLNRTEKARTKDRFTEAVNHLIENNHEKAYLIFSQLIQEAPNDKVLYKYFNILSKVHNRSE